MQIFRLALRAVLYQDAGRWLAHCLEMDLIGEGVTREEALDSLSESIHMQVEFSVENNNVANIFQPADARYLQMFAAGQDLPHAQFRVEAFSDQNLRIDRLEAREYSGSDALLAAAN
ncbi:MAG TPA: hypothetical protein VH253_15905 [Phycisphaerae bacterium]|nr:hypothetical protein [Phycisphaerae bacterium]